MMLSKRVMISVLPCLLVLAGCCDKQKNEKQTKPEEVPAMKGKVKLMTLDPAHFHASLVQKFMYDQVDPVVHVYAPEGDELQEHLKRVESYNTRAENPTKWQEKVYTGPDFLEKMVKEKPGNVVVISGNNAKKTKYIMACIEAGLNVLADKPMAIVPDDYVLLKKAFEVAKVKGLFLYDIMTERSEITTLLQKELSHIPDIFGTLENGTPEKPAVTKESVHHYFKYVSGKPLKRPAWFFDVNQQGEAIVDVTTHLVDLVQWECFPEQTLDCEKDVEIISARRWITKITSEQFKKATLLDNYPDYLKKDVGADNVLNVYGNGEFIFKLKGVYAKASVMWNFEAPPGTLDTHYSIMRGSKADIVIRQGKEQNYKPTLYVEKKSAVPDEEFEKILKAGITKLNAAYPGVDMKKADKIWEIIIPDKYKVGHEAHFAEVTKRYLEFLAEGKMPAWEVPNMIVKYYTITKAYEKSR
ncbi:MAG: putative oxidoreductase C-terminal domain-containing protein [Kiritimatiellae bacterium]|nr:putative oxidoreductase C-terminal domain-containing protein [Kiritimatiellia bacterium]MDD5522893.1 putative oxidoreductase C-terminal domain-containing protein [Kiritimatiellia bacterium]